MGACNVDGCDGDDQLSFRCNECGGRYCSTHRLPENHSCRALGTIDLAIGDDLLEVERNNGTSAGDVLAWLLALIVLPIYVFLGIFRGLFRHPVLSIVLVAILLVATVLTGAATPILHSSPVKKVAGSLDSDGDGLTNAQEAKIGTNPHNPDTDGDGIPDGAEYHNQTASGVPIPNADPLHKDVYVNVNYAEGLPHLTGSEKASLRRVWAAMNVSNPDGTTGIRLHLNDSKPYGGGVSKHIVVHDFSRARFNQLRDHYQNSSVMGPRPCVYHEALFVEASDSQAAGQATEGGFMVVAAGNAKYEQKFGGAVSFRVHIVTHELLHNIVGVVPVGSRGSSKFHSQQGWLAEVSPSMSTSLRSDEELSPGVARKLSRNVTAMRCST